jgi:hypothetical protein
MPFGIHAIARALGVLTQGQQVKGEQFFEGWHGVASWRCQTTDQRWRR